MTKSSYQNAKEKNAFNKKQITKLIKIYEEDIRIFRGFSERAEKENNYHLATIWDAKIERSETTIKDLKIILEYWKD